MSSLKKGLVGYWSFNQDAKDRTPYSNHGTVNGATLTTDRKGHSDRSYKFDGNDNWIDIDSVNGFNGGSNQPHTITMWAKIDSSKIGGADCLFTLGTHFGGKTSAFERRDGSTWNWYFWSNDVIYPKPPYNEWVHMTFVYDGSDYGSPSSRQVYYNGEKQTHTSDSSDSSDASSLNSNPPFAIGADPFRDRYVPGKIDGIRLYNRALSQQEIEKLYESYY